MSIFHEALPGDLARRIAASGDRLPRRVGAREPARTMMWSLEAGGWSEREIEHIRFLRALVETGRLDR
jgi:hypothetical protein